MAIDFSEFYLLSNAFKRGALHVDTTETIDQFRLGSGNVRVISPIVFEWQSGGRSYDLVGTTYAGLYLISKKFMDLLQVNKFTGWDTYPVCVTGKGGNQLQGYVGLIVNGKGGPMDRKRSKRILQPPQSPKGSPVEVWRGLYFDPIRWDHTDMFLLEKSLFKIVTKEVKEEIDKASLTNVMLRPLTEVELDAL